MTDEASAKHRGFPARDARITNARGSNGQEGTIFLRVIKAGSRLYQLQYIQVGSDVPSPPGTYATIRDSLKIS